MKTINNIVRIAKAIAIKQKRKFDLDVTPDLNMNFSGKRPCCSEKQK